MKRSAPAAERNLSVILSTFGPRLHQQGLVLEVASGTGQHAAAFASAYPKLEWQPSDPDPAARASIQAYCEEAGGNLRSPLNLDVAEPWPIEQADGLLNINMIHISPWSATEALFGGAGRILTAGAPLMLYGPFMRDGRHTAPSNADFDGWLKSKNPDYGVRDVDAVTRVAEAAGFERTEIVSMPANNFSVFFRRG